MTVLDFRFWILDFGLVANTERKRPPFLSVLFCVFFFLFGWDFLFLPIWIF